MNRRQADQYPPRIDRGALAWVVGIYGAALVLIVSWALL